MPKPVEALTLEELVSRLYYQQTGQRNVIGASGREARRLLPALRAAMFLLSTYAARVAEDNS